MDTAAQKLPTELRRKELKPLPLRVTQQQYDRLVQARARDGLAVQEHVRRALDFYLDAVELSAAKTQAGEANGNKPGKAQSVPGKTRPKVVRK